MRISKVHGLLRRWKIYLQNHERNLNAELKLYHYMAEISVSFETECLLNTQKYVLIHKHVHAMTKQPIKKQAWKASERCSKSIPERRTKKLVISFDWKDGLMNYSWLKNLWKGRWKKPVKC